MTFAVVYAKDAVDDIDAAFDWLAARVPAAAVDLLKAIGRAEIHLNRNPAIYQVVRGNPSGDIRRVNLRPFRYQLYFQIVTSEVVVIACLHASRSPKVHAQILSDRV
jgi:plasmid stabilization system protein ParE